MQTDNPNIEINVNIKGRAEPIRIGVSPTMTPKEVIDDLQSQNQIPKLDDRRVAVTHGTTNLQLDVSLARQNVKNGDTLTVVWDGALAGAAS